MTTSRPALREDIVPPRSSVGCAPRQLPPRPHRGRVWEPVAYGPPFPPPSTRQEASSGVATRLSAGLVAELAAVGWALRASGMWLLSAHLSIPHPPLAQ